MRSGIRWNDYADLKLGEKLFSTDNVYGEDSQIALFSADDNVRGSNVHVRDVCNDNNVHNSSGGNCTTMMVDKIEKKGFKVMWKLKRFTSKNKLKS